MAKKKEMAMLVRVSVPKGMTAIQARREVRTLVNEQCNFSADPGEVRLKFAGPVLPPKREPSAPTLLGISQNATVRLAARMYASELERLQRRMEAGQTVTLGEIAAGSEGSVGDLVNILRRAASLIED